MKHRIITKGCFWVGQPKVGKGLKMKWKNPKHCITDEHTLEVYERRLQRGSIDCWGVWMKGLRVLRVSEKVCELTSSGGDANG